MGLASDRLGHLAVRLLPLWLPHRELARAVEPSLRGCERRAIERGVAHVRLLGPVSKIWVGAGVGLCRSGGGVRFGRSSFLRVLPHLVRCVVFPGSAKMLGRQAILWTGLVVFFVSGGPPIEPQL